MKRRPIQDRITFHVSRGHYSKAIAICHSVLKNHPEDLSIRTTLGELYYHLRNYEQAGRYWYLLEHKTPDQQKACEIFSSSINNDPQAMLRQIKYQADIHAIKDVYAKTLMESLSQECEVKYHSHFSYEMVNSKYLFREVKLPTHPDYQPPVTPMSKLKSVIEVVTIFLVLALLVAVILAGLKTVGEMIWAFLQNLF